MVGVPRQDTGPHRPCSKQVLDLNWMLGEKTEELGRRELELELRAVALAEAQAWGLNPWDNHDELMELIELRGSLRDVEVDHIIEVGRLATLVRDVCKALEDLCMSAMPGIPRDQCTTRDVLGAVMSSWST
jgi:hypothetical protein